VIFIRHPVFHVIGEIQTADISIILGFYSMEHTKLVFRDPTSNPNVLCSIVSKSRIIQTSGVAISLITGNTGWQMRIIQDVKYLGALALFFLNTFDINHTKLILSHLAGFDNFAPLLDLQSVNPSEI
jgi:hypothetical protein